MCYGFHIEYRVSWNPYLLSDKNSERHETCFRKYFLQNLHMRCQKRHHFASQRLAAHTMLFLAIREGHADPFQVFNFDGIAPKNELE